METDTDTYKAKFSWLGQFLIVIIYQTIDLLIYTKKNFKFSSFEPDNVFN